MTVNDLIKKTDWKVLAGSTDKDISSAYICDLLSWVMSHGKPGTVWITVQTHMNVVAVAALHDFACVIIPESIDVSDEVLNVANAKDVCIVSAPSSAYAAAGILSSLSISDV
jgi:predicted transcriptional regulator